MYTEGFSSVDAVRLTGISQPMLNYLCRVGVVVPTLSRRRGKRGHGAQRRYTFTDLISFKVVKRLTATGVSPVKVQKAIRELHRLGVSVHELPASRVVMFDESVYLWDGAGDPLRVADGQRAFGFILDLEGIRDELVRDIEKLAA